MTGYSSRYIMSSIFSFLSSIPPLVPYVVLPNISLAFSHYRRITHHRLQSHYRRAFSLAIAEKSRHRRVTRHHMRLSGLSRAQGPTEFAWALRRPVHNILFLKPTTFVLKKDIRYSRWL